MREYRIVSINDYKHVIEVKKVIKKWYWFGGSIIEWKETNIEGTEYGEKYHLPGGLLRYSRILIPRQGEFKYKRQAQEKIKEFLSRPTPITYPML